MTQHYWLGKNDQGLIKYAGTIEATFGTLDDGRVSLTMVALVRGWNSFTTSTHKSMRGAKSRATRQVKQYCKVNHLSNEGEY